MSFTEFLKIVFFGVVEGLTEWLPVGNDAHVYLASGLTETIGNGNLELLIFSAKLGALLAAMLIFWSNLWPFCDKKEQHFLKIPVLALDVKIFIACLPLAVCSLVFGKWLGTEIYTDKRADLTLAAPMIFYGIMFLIMEKLWSDEEHHYDDVSRFPFKSVFFVSVLTLPAIVPGTGISAAVVLAALFAGADRRVASELAFYVAIPFYLISGLLKIIPLIKGAEEISGNDIVIFLTAGIVAFLAAFCTISYYLPYIRRKNFKVFGYYRIIAGVLMLLYFELISFKV